MFGEVHGVTGAQDSDGGLGLDINTKRYKKAYLVVKEVPREAWQAATAGGSGARKLIQA